jgi:CBS domain-containing protein
MRTVAQVMHQGVISCAPGSSVTTIARTMAAHHIHCVVVPGHGIVTDLELTAALDGSSAMTAAALARSAPTLDQTETLERAATVLHEHGATHALVVNARAGRVIGVLSTLDLANAWALR